MVVFDQCRLALKGQVCHLDPSLHAQSQAHDALIAVWKVYFLEDWSIFG